MRPSSAPLPPSSSPSGDTLHASVHQLTTPIIRRLFTLLDGRSMCRLCRCASWVREAHMEPLVAATESHGLGGVVRFDKWLVGRQLRAALTVVEMGDGPGHGWRRMKRVLVLVGQCRSCELPVTVRIDAASNHPQATPNDDVSRQTYIDTRVALCSHSSHSGLHMAALGSGAVDTQGPQAAANPSSRAPCSAGHHQAAGQPLHLDRLEHRRRQPCECACGPSA